MGNSPSPVLSLVIFLVTLVLFLRNIVWENMAVVHCFSVGGLHQNPLGAC